MGGAIGGGFTPVSTDAAQSDDGRFGNHTPYAEFNLYCDPEAAREVLSNNPTLARKTTLTPLDLTHQLIATSETRLGLLFGYGGGGATKGMEPTMEQISPVRRLFFEILTYFAKTYQSVFGFRAGPPTHDPLAVIAAFAPSLFSCHPTEPRSDSDSDEEEVEEKIEEERLSLIHI